MSGFGVFDAHASPQDDAIRQQQQIQQQQEQRRLELQREHRKMLDAPPSGENLNIPKGPEAKPDAPCFEANSIELTGVTLLSQGEIDALTAPYLGRCLTLADVNNLVRDVTNAYIDKGYVTTRAAVPEQDFSSGNLVILVVEGKVEGIEFQDGHGRARELGAAFPGITGEFLNLRDIEQGLDQMNRLPSNDAKMELAPGAEPGTSRIVVSNEKTKTWRASVGFDNSGQDSTGRNQYVLSLGKDNLIGANDLLNLTFNADSDAWLTGKRQKSATFNGFYSIPYGYWTFSGSLSFYDYRTSIASAGSEFSSYGDTTTTSLTVDRVLRRDGDSKTSMGLSLTVRDTQNYFNGGRLASSSQVVSAAGLSLNHSHRVLGGIVSGQVGVSHGLPILGADRDRQLDHDEPRSQFTKTTYSGSFYRPFQIESTNFYLDTSFSGQWSEQTLFSAERFSVGSRYTVRGFHDDSLSGDTGAYVRNEIGVSVSADPQTSPLRAQWLGTAHIYLGYDAGVIRNDPKEEEEGGSLQGAVVGMRTTGGRLLADFAVAHPLDAPAFLGKREIETYFSLRYSF